LRVHLLRAGIVALFEELVALLFEFKRHDGYSCADPRIARGEVVQDDVMSLSACVREERRTNESKHWA
jgi:hypothetical protein